MPGDRRVVRAAFFTVQETGQWLGSWTPWYGLTTLPADTAYRLPAGSHVVAEVHYRGTSEAVAERGTLGLFFADRPTRFSVSDLVLDAKAAGPVARGAQKLRAETRLAADTRVWALRPEIAGGVTSLEVAARSPNGSTAILLFAKDFTPDWPTPYVLATPVLLRRGTTLSVTAYGGSPSVGTLRVTVSRY
jgi:hypothetical protein